MATQQDDLVAVARRYRAELRAMEVLRQEKLVRAWVAITRVLEAHAEALAARILAGETAITPSLVLQHERYRALIAEAKTLMDQFAASAGSIVAADLQAAAGLATEAVRETLAVAGVWDRVPAEAVRALVEWTGDETRPLVKLIAASWPESVDAMIRELLVAVGAGRGPAELARRMMRAFDVGLNRALTISRTEVLRAYRRGQLDGYRASEVVIGYKRLATHDARVCLGCLFTEGMTFDQVTDFDAHPNCRCTMVPIVIGVTTPAWTAGEAWFLAQPAERQRTILGETRYQLWRSGHVKSLKDFAMHTHDPEWGGAFVPTPIRDLKAA